MFNKLVNYLLPLSTYFIKPKCSICSSNTAFLCIDCLKKLNYSVNYSKVNDYDHIYFSSYTDEFKSFFSALKFRCEIHAGQHVVKELTTYLMAQSLFKSVNYWVSVPYHPLRLYQRGFNVVKFLFEPYFDLCLIPHLSLLKRRSFSKHLHAFSKNKRKKALEDVFCFSENKKVDLSHANLLLVDDIVTTKQTLQACISVLEQHVKFKSLTCVSLVTVE